jgi:8-oxo-dGTP pyrophosphatase MutT (NUDIX family)
MFEDFKIKLKDELSTDLPGKAAHLIMMPTSGDAKLVTPTFEPPPIRSAVLILFYPADDGSIKFPLIQRPTYNGAHSGQIAFPGGKAEDVDANLVQTALREAEEEIGINPKNIEVVGSLTDLHIAVSNFIVHPVVGFSSEMPDFVLDRIEVQALIESDLHDIVRPDKRKQGTVTARGKYKINTPYFDIGDNVVWGATAMMLSELSIIVGKTGILEI